MRAISRMQAIERQLAVAPPRSPPRLSESYRSFIWHHSTPMLDSDHPEDMDLTEGLDNPILVQTHFSPIIQRAPATIDSSTNLGSPSILLPTSRSFVASPSIIYISSDCSTLNPSPSHSPVVLFYSPSPLSLTHCTPPMILSPLSFPSPPMDLSTVLSLAHPLAARILSDRETAAGLSVRDPALRITSPPPPLRQRRPYNPPGAVGLSLQSGCRRVRGPPPHQTATCDIPLRAMWEEMLN